MDKFFDADFHAYDYPLARVLPTLEQACDYLHLDDETHPAYLFLCQKLQELSYSTSRAKGGYVVRCIESMNREQGVLGLSQVDLHPGGRVCGYFAGGTHLALFVCTAGEVFNRQIEAYQRNEATLKAYVVDAIGSLCVENAMDAIHETLEQSVQRMGWGVSNRYSPGYCHWPLTDQINLFQAIGPHPTGVTLNDSCLMFPSKSVSGAIAIGPSVQKQAYRCHTCQHPSCLYRRKEPSPLP